MKLIAHRGNIDGPTEFENDPKYIMDVLQQGYEAEVDVWIEDNKIMLGHDFARYEVAEEYLVDIHKASWFHAKNLEALRYLLDFNEFRTFWHQNDDFTLTSNGIIWTYPGKEITTRSIIVAKTLEDTLCYGDKDLYGVCSDYVGELR